MKVNPRRKMLTPAVLLVLVMLSLSLVIPSQPTLAARPPTKTPTPSGPTPTPTSLPPGAGWSIGALNDSAAEFAGSVGTFTVGVSPTSAFPARLSGANTTETLIFNMSAISGDYYLKIVAGDTAQNSISGLQATLNGHRLTPRWARHPS